MGYLLVMQTVVETPTFIRRAEKLLDADERKELIDQLAAYPYAGDEIPGTAGVRKLRFGAKGKGKRGGARVIYYVLDDATPIYALLIYGKNESDDLSPEQFKAVRAFAIAIKAVRKR